MEGFVNIFGALTALTCSVLLYRGYRRTGAQLLAWGAACFLGLALESAVLFVDLYVLTGYPLYAVRYFFSISGISCLIYGLIHQAE